MATTKAFLVIAQRAIEQPVYGQVTAAATELATNRILDICQGLGEVERVEALKTHGGMTKIINDAIEESITRFPNSNISIGSPMIPMTVADIIRTNREQVASKVRFQVWQHLN